MGRKKKEINKESEIKEEVEFNENDTEKEINLDDEEDSFDSGFYFELDEEIVFSTKKSYQEEDEDISLDIAFTDDDPRDRY